MCSKKSISDRGLPWGNCLFCLLLHIHGRYIYAKEEEIPAHFLYGFQSPLSGESLHEQSKNIISFLSFSSIYFFFVHVPAISLLRSSSYGGERCTIGTGVKPVVRRVINIVKQRDRLSERWLWSRPQVVKKKNKNHELLANTQQQRADRAVNIMDHCDEENIIKICTVSRAQIAENEMVRKEDWIRWLLRLTSRFCQKR